MKLIKYRELPKNLFGLLFWNIFLFYMPIFLVLGLLALFGIRPVEFDDKPTYGILGIVWAIVLGPLMTLVTTFAIWIIATIGNLIVRLLTKPKKRMTILKPKDFIKSVLIDELGTMIDKYPYFSFIFMGIGIEFLGKCLATTRNDWNEGGHSGPDFKNAIRTIPSLQKYEPYLVTYDLYSSFRCGLAHAISPKIQVTLSSKGELGHRVERDGRLNLKVEDFYDDFKLACEYIINQSYAPTDKMNGDFLQVPGTTFNSGTDISTGLTSSYSPSTGSTTQTTSGTTPRV